MNTGFAFVSTAAFWAAVIAAAAPLLLGTLGALICGRAGVLPLAAEGIAAAAAAASLITRTGADPWIALAVAAAAGLAIGLVHAVLVGPLALSQHLAGFALLLVTLGGAHVALGPAGAMAPALSAGFAAIDLRWLTGLPRVDAVLHEVLRQPPTVLLAVLLILAVGYVLAATPLGLALRVCGESPDAVSAQGRSVNALRVFAGMTGSALMALAAANLALADAAATGGGAFDGRGFVWLALAAAARWRLPRAFALAALLALLQAALAAMPDGFAALGLARAMPLLPYLAALAAFATMSGDGMRRFAPRM